MPLKYRYLNQKEIPSDLAPYYRQQNGSFVLDVDGAIDKSRLDELHSANLTLTRERDELYRRFEGIDPDEVRKLADEKRQLEEAQQLKAGEFQKVLENRLKHLRLEFEKKISSLDAERQDLHQRLSAIQIDQGVDAAATKRGLCPAAIPDITARARAVFKLVDGVPRVFDPAANAVRPGRDGLSPMSLDEWIDLQTSEAPHLFEPSTGTGEFATSPPANRRRPARNPFRKESWNLTEQMRLQKTDPNLAAVLRSAA